MRLAGYLIWYDESPSWLATAVAGFARFCDPIVALDGAYGLYPGARARSRPDQAEAIMSTCEALDVGCVVYRPSEPYWGNEVEKRNLALQLCRPHLKAGDWVCAFDADYHVLQAQPEMILWELEQTDRNVATYTLLDGKDLMADEYLAVYAAGRPIDSEWTMRTRGLYRWTDDLRYEHAHWLLHGTYDGRDQWIYGPELVPTDERAFPLEPAHNLDAALVVHHRNQHRPLSRREAAAGYYQNRQTVGAEQVPERAA